MEKSPLVERKPLISEECTVLVPLITNQYVCVFFYGWGCTDIVLKTVVSFFPDSLLQTAFQKMRANFLYQDSRKDFEYFLLVARKGPIFQEYNIGST